MEFTLATDKTPAGDPSTKGSYFAFVRGENRCKIVYYV